MSLRSFWELRRIVFNLSICISNSSFLFLLLSADFANPFFYFPPQVLVIIQAIKAVSAGEPYISHQISMRMVKNRQPVIQEESKVEVELSKRELEVLGLIADGYTNTEIAEMTFTSKRTVETHRKNLIEKTDTKNTASLIKFAIMNGLVK